MSNDNRRWIRRIPSAYYAINSANLSGAIDIIVVKQNDGTLRCSPFHVRFGKLSVMQASQKEVYITINDQDIDHIQMELGEAGQAVFINDIDPVDTNPDSVSTNVRSQSNLSNIDPSSFTNVIKPTIETISSSEHRSDHEKQQLGITSKKQNSNENCLTSFPQNDDIKISLSSKQEQSDNNESIFNEQSENDELLETQTTHISSNPIFINSPSTIERKSKLARESSTPMSNMFEPRLSQSMPNKSFTTITTGSFPIPINETDNRTSNSELNVNFPLTQSVESIQSDSEYEFEKSTQSLINTQQTSPNRTSGKWQWGWGQLPQQRRAAQFIRRSSEFFSSFWPLRQRVTSTEDIYSDNNLSTICQSLPEARDNDDKKSSKNNSISESSFCEDEFSSTQFSLCGNLNNPSLITDELFSTHLVSPEMFVNNPEILNDPNLVVRIDGKFYNWPIASLLLASMERRSSFDNEDYTKITTLTNKVERKLSISDIKFENISKTENDHDTKMKEKLLLSSSSTTTTTHTTSLKSVERTMILSSDQLKRFDLKLGVNKVKFSVTTAIQGTSAIEANIFLFDQNTKFIISDIDGTITKSDVLGHIFAWFGRNWAHEGIAEFFNAIYENGYQFIYLSARGIGQSQITRDFLGRIEQRQCSLPLGPLLISPDSLMAALHREIIAKRPEDFKIECLKSIADLFPNRNPFYAGFGNRINDQYAYTTVGIPASHIFTINPQSVIIREKLSRVQYYYYKDLHDLVDLIFPPIDTHVSSEIYSAFTYWRTNPTMDTTFDDEIQAQMDEINEREKRSKAAIKKQSKRK